MARLRCDFFSEVLGLSTSMTVILPQATSSQIGMPGSARRADHPTLYLLHGLSDDDTTWSRRTSIERYAAPLGLAVVMPQVHRSFYTDEVHGNRYWTFLSEELPVLARGFFGLSDQRQDTFVAGLSMGGYGALKWALRDPGRFAAAASLSGALDMGRRQRAGGPPEDPRRLDRIFGDEPVAGTSNDLMWLLDQVDLSATVMPELYVCCGTEDSLYDENATFRDACQAKGIALTVDFGSGEHDWGYWDAKIQDVLDWLPVATREDPT
jgi:S-formylglutathione hydrolase FrmB